MPPPITIQAKVLAAGVVTPLVPPYRCARLQIGNATPDDLRIYSQNLDLAQYEIVIAGTWSNPFQVDGDNQFSPSQVLYANAIAGGTVRLRWM